MNQNVNAQISEQLIGLNLDSARSVVEQEGYSIRPVVIDGVHQMVHEDFRTWRINVAVDNGVVTKILGFY